MSLSARLPRQLINQLLQHAQSFPDAEVCGLVAARAGWPERLYRVANVAEEPGRLFTLDPQGQIDAMRRMRETGEELFAIYHSHPHAPALPSATDLRESAYPEALYLIISLNTKGVLEMRGWRLLAGEAQEVELETVESAEEERA